MGFIDCKLLNVPVSPYRALGVIPSDSISNTAYENIRTAALIIRSQLRSFSHNKLGVVWLLTFNPGTPASV